MEPFDMNPCSSNNSFALSEKTSNAALTCLSSVNTPPSAILKQAAPFRSVRVIKIGSGPSVIRRWSSTFRSLDVESEVRTPVLLRWVLGVELDEFVKLDDSRSASGRRRRKTMRDR